MTLTTFVYVVIGGMGYALLGELWADWSEENGYVDGDYEQAVAVVLWPVALLLTIVGRVVRLVKRWR